MKIRKILALVLSTLTVLGSVATCAAESVAPEKNTKYETAYVLAHADGSVEKTIVSNWLCNRQGTDTVPDVTRLTDIVNVKGDEAFTQGEDNSCLWEARGKDIYYQGTTDQTLPVSVAVSYTLDGQPLTPEELAGKSGTVVIRFDYTNNQYETVSLNGQQEKIYVPFAMVTGVVLDNGVFSNVSVTNGKIVNDGERTMVAGVAFPGLQDSLGLDRDILNLPEYMEITADVEGFALESTLTLAAKVFPDDGLAEPEALAELKDPEGLEAQLGQLTGAMGQLMDGSSQLYDGLSALLDSSRELVAGIDQLTAGSAQLQQGAVSLKGGAAQLQEGAAALGQGLDALAANNDALNGGAAQVFQSLLDTANAQLTAAQVPKLTAENYAQVLDGVIAAAGDSPAGQQAAGLKAGLDSYYGFYQGLLGYTAGVTQAQAGAQALNQGMGSLKAGADSLTAGADQLYDGICAMQSRAPALVEGVGQLREGSKALSDGLNTFNEEAVEKLVDALDGDLGGLMDRLEAVKAVSDGYTTFSGADPDMDSQVKFVWRTESVGIQK